MAKMSYEEATQVQAQQYNDNGYIPRFYLDDDGHEAVVRIMHDALEDFDIVGSHQVKTRGKDRDIDCIRGVTDPLSTCPFCAADMRIRTRMYIHLLVYTVNEQNQVVVEPRVWDRHIDYREKLKSYIENYGPLSDMVCKIVRHGAKGDTGTFYDIIPALSRDIYPDNVYVKDPTPFAEYSSVGTVVWTKSAQDMQFYVQNGEFPQRQQDAPSAPAVPASPMAVNPAAQQYAPPAAPQQAYAPAPAPAPMAQPVAAAAPASIAPAMVAPPPAPAPVAQAPVAAAPAQAPVAEQAVPANRDVPPWERPEGDVQRPTRTY